MAFQFKRFTIPCVQCGHLTNKSYARANGGKCKACTTGVAPTPKAHTCTCGVCGATCEMTHEAAFQEYPGASVQGGYWFYECKCGHSDTKTDLRGYNIRENTRGW